MESLFQDVRYGFRMLLKNPGFTIVAIIALALGIGANSAIFSVVNAVLLRPLPYEESDKLLLLSERSPVLEGMSVSYPNFLDWRTQNTAFEHLAVFRRNSFNLIGGGEPEQLIGGQVSADLFPALRVKPAIGRTFLPEEDKPEGVPVVLLSHGLWQRRFGSDPNIVGQTLTLNSKGYTVIGVMPANYQFPNRTELWVPVGQESGQKSWQQRGNHPGLYGIARLKPGVNLEQARTELDTIAVRLEQQYPDTNTGNRISINYLLDQIVSDIRPALYVLLSAVGFVLLIACANVANLFLARAATRQKEIAVRIALGASRFRLIRQLLTESVMLSIVGGGLGLALAKWGVALLIKVSPNAIPRSGEISLDKRVLLFTLGLSFLTGIVFGLVPALQASKPDLNETLKDATKGSSGGARRQRFRNGLVISEVALALVLLIGGGLMLRSFYLLQKVDPGFGADHLLSFQISLPQSTYPEDQQRIAFFEQVVQRLSALPGVDSAAIASGLPLGNNGNQTSFFIEGQPEPEPGKTPLAEVVRISPNYFRTMRIPLLKGRELNVQDSKDSPKVLLVDEAFARRYWPNDDPIGKRINFGGKGHVNLVTVVGIIGRVKMEGLDTDSNRVQAYFPYSQGPWNGMTVVMRASGDPASLTAAARQQILEIDKDQPISNVKTIDQIWNDSVAPQRLNMLLLGTFAAVALILATVGIYGVMSYSVSQRTHEIGIRIALGAQQRDVLKLVVGQAMILAFIGVVVGLVTSFALTRLMSKMLFGVSATDPFIFSSIVVLLLSVSLIASFVPARRATRVDPIVALKYE
jgi:putative ABC transport system permease protein